MKTKELTKAKEEETVKVKNKFICILKNFFNKADI